MDRKALKAPFSFSLLPEWACPTCGKSVLSLDKKTFHRAETRFSRNRPDADWGPDGTDYVYSCLLVCTNAQCKEVVTSTGIGFVEADQGQDEHGDWTQEYEDYFRPKFFEPHLILFGVPTRCPKSVVSSLHESFRLFFANPNAAANCVRISIERLLTELKVKRFRKSKGSRSYIKLHDRIALLPARYDKLKKMFYAIKWLGNVGSHAEDRRQIKMDDVMDCYEFAEHILDEVYASNAKRLASLAGRVNKKRGPAR